MVIFIDTSALFALAAKDDVNHLKAREILDRAMAEGHTLLLHNLIVVECVSLLHRRKSYDTACHLIKELTQFKTIIIDEEIHNQSLKKFTASLRRRISLVDQVSFLVMKREGIKHAFAFDEDFVREGFNMYGNGSSMA